MKYEKEIILRREQALKEKCNLFEKVKNINLLNNKNVIEKCTGILSPYCLQQQISAMLRNRTSNIKKWSETDIANALILKCISPKAYRYTRKLRKIPLPAIYTLNRHIENISCEPEILKNVLKLLKILSESLATKKKTVRSVI